MVQISDVEKNVDCVVGSGPSGVACAAALLEQGRTVRMLDAGLRLEPERDEIVQRLAHTPPEQWSDADRQWLTSSMNPSRSGIPQKLLFGSDYPYRDAERHLGTSRSGVGLEPSLAFGGLSTVWGAAMMPCTGRDIADWPITIEQLAPHYEAVLKFTGLSAAGDDLAEQFPLFTDSPGQLELSRPAQALRQALERNREKLRSAGIHHGRARVAIKAARGEVPGCVHCGMCMYGCPYGYIYNSATTVAQMQRSAKFQYEPDLVVRTLREESDAVVVSGFRPTSGEPFEVRARSVFLAAGAIPTTGILLRSLAAHDHTLRMKDSQYFLLPLALTRRIPDVRSEKLHALSQIFLEVMDAEISPHTIHLQIYSFNDLIGKALRKSFGPLARPLEFLACELEGRLLLIQGFVHSAHSSEIAVTLRREPGTEREQLRLEPLRNPEARQVVHRVVRKLVKHTFKLGALPLPPLLQIAEPGRSFHSGGTFPMRATPGEFESDLLGRPRGWQRVHAVDATVLPSIPATTITFTVMANAHRIASEATRLDMVS